MYKLEILVRLKNDVLDPQGKAISHAARSISISNVLDVKQGKYFEIFLEKANSIENARLIASKLSEKLLCNEVIETYKIIKIKKI